MLSSGHNALDHRIFSKQALTLVREFPRVRIVAVHDGNETRDGVRIDALRPYRSRAERFLVHPVRCLLGARGRGPRVLILHDAELLLWVPVVRLLTRWRLIYDVHEDFANLIVRRTWLPRPLKAFARSLGRLEKRLARMCDGVMSVTQTLVDRFDHPRRVAVYNLPTADFVQSAAEAAARQPVRDYDLVHLGTLSQERLAFLLDVVAHLEQARPEVRILLIGLRPGQAEQVAARLPRARIENLEQVPYAGIPELLVRCAVGVNVHPVLHPHLVCAVPVKVFEYLAAGCDVVTSYLPELDRLLGKDANEHVVTVEEARAERYAEETARLLEKAPEPAARRALMDRVAARWSWRTEGEKLVEFVRSVAVTAR